MAVKTFTPERARRLFLYDHETGKLFWRERPRSDFLDARHWNGFNTKSAGREVGTPMKSGHLRVRFGEAGFLVHRIIWLIEYGEWPEQIDHIDGNPANNRLSNLREVNQLLNCKNAARRSDNQSGTTGISRASHSGRWVATISNDGQRVHLGQYKTLDEAVAARKAAEKVLGYHKNHGRENVAT